MKGLDKMKLAIVGSRNCEKLTVEQVIAHIPPDTTQIISGGAVGVDALAHEAANRLSIPITEFLPDYDIFGKTAPLVRNKTIVDNADCIIAFWDYESKGTRNTLIEALKQDKNVKIILIDENGREKII